MSNIRELFSILSSDGELLQLRFGTPEAVWRQVDDEVRLVRSHNNVVLLSFSQWSYGVFRSGILETAKTLDSEIQSKLCPSELAQLPDDRNVSMSAASPAFKYRNRLLIPWIAIYNFWGWLRSQDGKAALAALKKLANQEPIEAPEEPVQKKRAKSGNGRKKAAAKAPAEAPIPGGLAIRDLQSLEMAFELVSVSNRQLPSVKEIRGFAADGADSREILEDEDKCTIWVLRDASGFQAALLGPKAGLAYEQEHSVKGQALRIPSVSFDELRSTDDMVRLLHRNGDVHTSGRRIITDSQGFSLATLLSLEHLLELFSEEQ